MAAEHIDLKVEQYPAYDVCDDDTFTSTLANHRMGYMYPDSLREQIHRPLGVSGVIGAYMAGMHCPSARRMTDLVHDISDIKDWEKYAVRELFEQLSPAECSEFIVTTNGTPREVARLMRVSGVRRGVLVNWVNQYSSDPNWREDKMLSIQYGEHLYCQERASLESRAARVAAKVNVS